MTFWKRLLGRRSSPAPAPTQLELIEQVARENAARQRQELERAPRMNPADRTAYVTRLVSIGEVGDAYAKMKRADFCDIVAAAIRAKKLSGDDASSAVYIREWVRTGGDARLSFPEWLEEEARPHFLLLNREWLQSGCDPGMSFHEWLMPPSDPDKIAPDEGESEPRVRHTRWLVDGKRITRTYEFSYVATPHSVGPAGARAAARAEPLGPTRRRRSEKRIVECL